MKNLEDIIAFSFMAILFAYLVIDIVLVVRRHRRAIKNIKTQLDHGKQVFFPCCDLCSPAIYDKFPDCIVKPVTNGLLISKPNKFIIRTKHGFYGYIEKYNTFEGWHGRYGDHFYARTTKEEVLQQLRNHMTTEQADTLMLEPVA